MTIQPPASIKRLWDNLKNVLQSEPLQKVPPFNGSNRSHEFIVIGLGRFGTSLAMSLTAYKHGVLAIDSDKTRIQQVSNTLPHVIQLDATDIEALREVGAEEFDTGIVCIGSDFESTLLATVNLNKLGINRVISKAMTVTQLEILLQVGADEVILPEHEAGVRLARRLAAIDFVDFLELSQDTGIVEILAPDDLVDKSLKEAEVRNRYGVSVVAIKRGDDVIVSPHADEVIREDDILVILGKISDCERMQE